MRLLGEAVSEHSSEVGDVSPGVGLSLDKEVFWVQGGPVDTAGTGHGPTEELFC